MGRTRGQGSSHLCSGDLRMLLTVPSVTGSCWKDTGLGKRRNLSWVCAKPLLPPLGGGNRQLICKRQVVS